MSQQLDNAVVVITGASNGIGRATALAMARKRAKLVLASRGASRLEPVRAETEAEGAEVVTVPTDVTDESAVAELARWAAERFGRIDVWLNNAGVILYGRFEETPADSFRRVIETNLFGQVHGARAVLPYFRRQGIGVLINMSSVCGRLTPRGHRTADRVVLRGSKSGGHRSPVWPVLGACSRQRSPAVGIGVTAAVLTLRAGRRPARDHHRQPLRAQPMMTTRSVGRIPPLSASATTGVVGDVVVPLAGRGPLARRPRVSGWLDRHDADRRAVARLETMRQRHGDGPVVLRLLGRTLAIVVSLELLLRLRACVLESLRLWPTTPAILGDTTEETKWGNGPLATGSGVPIYVPYCHRNQRFLPQADRFAPELWLEPSTASGPILIPFSSGPAVCPGRNLVLLVTSSLLAQMLSRAELRQASPRGVTGAGPVPATFSPFELGFRVRPIG